MILTMITSNLIQLFCCCMSCICLHRKQQSRTPISALVSHTHSPLHELISAADFAGLNFLSEAARRIFVMEMSESEFSYVAKVGRESKWSSQFIENGPIVWVMITLLAVTFPTATTMDLVVNIFSIALSFVCLASITIGTCRVAFDLWCRGQKLRALDRFLMTVQVATWLILNTIRLIGVFWCPSHSFQFYPIGCYQE